MFRADDGTLIGTTFFGGPPNNVFMTNWFDKKLEKPTRLENYLILKTLWAQWDLLKFLVS